MKVALFISTVFEPMTVLLVVSVFGGWYAGLRGVSLYWYYGYLFSFLAIVSFMRFVMAKKDHTNWDVSERKKRITPLLVLMGIFLGNLWIVSMFGASNLTAYNASWFIWIVGFFLITLKTKISGHLSVLTLALGFLIRWYGVSYWPILLLLPLVGWSRIVLKRHTLVEVFGGILYSAFLLFFLW